jgi:hypothetical protein
MAPKIGKQSVVREALMSVPLCGALKACARAGNESADSDVVGLATIARSALSSIAETGGRRSEK